jgi:phosphatidylglycerol:prolipoprotein diacylglycerol transferase
MLTYPHINPIAISIGPVFGFGPLRVHWYGIMYLIGFVAAWWLARYRAGGRVDLDGARYR